MKQVTDKTKHTQIHLKTGDHRQKKNRMVLLKWQQKKKREEKIKLQICVFDCQYTLTYYR